MGTKNKCSVLHLKDCSEVTKLDSEVSLSQENFHFLRSGQLSSQGLAVQARSDSCLASLRLARQSERGWTAIPRLDSPDQGKYKFSRQRISREL